MNLKEQMEQIYQNAPAEKIPWNIQQPPEQLVKLVEDGTVSPCRAVDLGCGLGNYALWLAKKGFDVTGIDLAEKAVKLAAKYAVLQKINCRFFAADLTSSEFNPDEKFDFAYDWEVLHHVFPDQRESYIKNAANLLENGGLYFSVCFSEQDPDFGGQGKYRKTPMDTMLYFSSEEEIEQL